MLVRDERPARKRSDGQEQKCRAARIPFGPGRSESVAWFALTSGNPDRSVILFVQGRAPAQRRYRLALAHAKQRAATSDLRDRWRAPG